MRVRLQVFTGAPRCRWTMQTLVVIVSATLLLNLMYPDRMRQPHSSTLACSAHDQVEGQELWRDDSWSMQ